MKNSNEKLSTETGQAHEDRADCRLDATPQDRLVQLGIPTETGWIEGGTGSDLREQVEVIKRWYRNDWIALDNKLRSPQRMAVIATTVKKPSENPPIKRARRRRCERKQTPQNRVSATKRRGWEKTVEAASLPVTHEVAGSSPVVPASFFNNLPNRTYPSCPDFNTDFNMEGHP